MGGKRGHSERARCAWTLSKRDNTPWRCLKAKRQRFTKEFKVEAIRLWKSSGRPASAVAHELGLRRNHLYKWQTNLDTHGETASPGKGGRAHSADDLTGLQWENARPAGGVRHFYKKAAIGSKNVLGVRPE